VRDLIPPLPRTPDEIAAFAGFAPPMPDVPQWVTVETSRGDPRTPWRAQDRDPSPARYVRNMGVLVVTGIGLGQGWRARLLRGPAPVREHTLVHAPSGRVVRFDNQRHAIDILNGIVAAGGNPPKGRAWDPPLDVTGAQWVPDHEYKRRTGVLDFAPITWRGAHHRWLIMSRGGSINVWRDRKPILLPSRQPRDFGSISEARAYCEREDAL
jgi:hypothetical protein